MSRFRINGWHVLAGFVVFFGLVIATDVSSFQHSGIRSLEFT